VSRNSQRRRTSRWPRPRCRGCSTRGPYDAPIVGTTSVEHLEQAVEAPEIDLSESVGRTETGRFEQYLHRMANELAGEAARNGCTVIAFEDLTDICDRIPSARQFHEWAFRRLYECRYFPTGIISGIESPN
jgi:hypothetical protein